MTELVEQQVVVMQHRENENVRKSGQGEAQRWKCKRLKPNGGQAYNRSSDRPATVCKVKVKCTFVQALRLCTGRTTHRGSRGIALLFLDHGPRGGLRGQRHAPAAL